MNAVCPACGVAVVPGYVRCPRCHAGLPLGPGRTKRMTGDPGGTALARRGFPVWVVLAVACAAVAIVVVLGLRGSSKPTVATPDVSPEPVEVAAQTVAPRVTSAPLGQPVSPQTPVAAAAPDRRAVVLELEDTLRRQRLWGRAEIVGQRIDVRSGSCADAAMRPAIESERSVLRGAGLTRLRCLEQSGAVVFERDL
jgi:hypothetical protein